jgi:toxin HigB-1
VAEAHLGNGVGFFSWRKFVLKSVTIRDTVGLMIKNFQHKGLEKFYRTGNKAGIQAKHADKLEKQLSLLEVATKPEDVNRAGWGLHPLKADLVNHWSIKVDRMWRLTFMFDGEDVILLDYQDYH